MDGACIAQHAFGGPPLGEHLGQLLVISWSVTISVISLRTRVLPRWLGLTGLTVSVRYLLTQGDIFATALPSFPSGPWPAQSAAPAGDCGGRPGLTLLLRPAHHTNPAIDDNHQSRD